MRRSWVLFTLFAIGLAVLPARLGYRWPAAGDEASVVAGKADARPSKKLAEPTAAESHADWLVREVATQRARDRLLWAEQQAERQVAVSLSGAETLFDDAQRATPALAEELLSFSSKWRMAVDCVPFTRGDRHAVYLRMRIAEHLFTSEQLRQAIEAAVRDYLSAVAGIEDQMIVSLRLDLEDLPQLALLSPIAERDLDTPFEHLLSEAESRAARGLVGDVGCLAVSEVASQIVCQVLRQVAVRLSVESGILGTGAASTWATLGTGLVLGIVVDWIVGKIWDWWADPRGDLAAMLNRELSDLRQRVFDGDQSVAGLRGALLAWSRQRAAMRKTVILGWFDED